jgi:peptide/nickel transport system permease protein
MRLVMALWVMLLAAGTVLPLDPDAVDMTRRHAAPSLEHPLGTDQLGRDMAARMMIGGQRTAIVLAIVAAIGLIGGGAVGMVAALLGGWEEWILLRVVELPIVLPTLVVALAVSALFGLTPVTAGLSLGLAGLGQYALMAHALARGIMSQPYFVAAEAVGASPSRLAARHVAPNILPILFVRLGSNAAGTILGYASLGFLGLGADSASSDWGSMLFEYRIYLFDDPALSLWPGLAIAAAAATFSVAFDRADA